MHEASIAQSMLELAEEQIGRSQPLLAVRVRVGTLSGVCPDALAFAFPEIAEVMGFGRPALAITVVPAKAVCKDCSATYPMDDAFALCPTCSSLNRHVEGGEDCLLESIELEESE